MSFLMVKTIFEKSCYKWSYGCLKMTVAYCGIPLILIGPLFKEFKQYVQAISSQKHLYSSNITKCSV